MVRRKVLIFLCLLFCWCTFNNIPCTRIKKLRRDTRWIFHSSASFCCAQIEIMLILVYTRWRYWRNIGYTMHIVYADSLRIISKWLRSKMELILNLYYHIMIQSCILVNITKLVCLLVFSPSCFCHNEIFQSNSWTGLESYRRRSWFKCSEIDAFFHTPYEYHWNNWWISLQWWYQ